MSKLSASVPSRNRHRAPARQPRASGSGHAPHEPTVGHSAGPSPRRRPDPIEQREGQDIKKAVLSRYRFQGQTRRHILKTLEALHEMALLEWASTDSPIDSVLLSAVSNAHLYTELVASGTRAQRKKEEIFQVVLAKSLQLLLHFRQFVTERKPVVLNATFTPAGKMGTPETLTLSLRPIVVETAGT